MRRNKVLTTRKKSKGNPGKISQPTRSIGSLDPKSVPKAIVQMLTALEPEHMVLDMPPRKPLGKQVLLLQGKYFPGVNFLKQQL